MEGTRKIVENKVQKQTVKQLINFLQRGLSEYTFEEVLAAVPQALDFFDDEQVSQLLAAILDYRES